MAKFMTAARKITLARLAGIGAGAGLMTALTKDLAVVCPIAGIAVIGTAVLHRRMKDLPADDEVSVNELTSVASRAAGEVVLASALVSVAKNGVKGLFKSKAPVDPTVVVDVVPADVDVAIPSV